MRRLCVCFSLNLLLLLLAVPAWAVHSRERQSLLVVHQEPGRVDTESPAGTVIDTKQLGGTLSYDIDPGETLFVQIADPNPLLFVYTWKETPKTPTANFTNLAEFTKSIKSLSEVLAPFGPKKENVSAGLAATALESNISALKKEDQELLQKFQEDVSALSKALDTIPAAIARSGLSFADAESVKSEVLQKNKEIQELLKRLEEELKQINDLEFRLVKEAPGEVDPLIQLLLLAKDQEPRIKEMISTLRDFVAAAKAIHVPVTFDPPLQFDATQDSGGVMEILATKGNEEQAGKANVKGKLGKYTFTVKPYSPVDFSVGPAVIYSFIETQEFGTKTENGKIVIVRKDSGNQVNGLTVGAMLSITPRAWSNPAFRGSIQVGASPVKDKIGLFLGGSVQFFNQVSIGGGIAYQQAQRLAPGLALNQEIASEDKLKTNVVFKSGFYLTVTLDFGGKK